MARYEYGQGAADTVVTADNQGLLHLAPGATVTLWDAQTGGTQQTDLIQPAAVGSAAVSTPLTIGANGLLPGFRGPDGAYELWVDGGSTRVRIMGSVPPGSAVSASTTVAGVVELATSAEMTTGTSTTLVPPVSAVSAYVTANGGAAAVTSHEARTDNPHAAAGLITATAAAATYIRQTSRGATDGTGVAELAATTGLIPDNRMNASTAAGANTMAKRDATGNLTATAPTLSTHLATRGYVDTAISAVAASEQYDIALASDFATTQSVTFTTITGFTVPLVANAKYRAEFFIRSTGATGDDIRIRPSMSAAMYTAGATLNGIGLGPDPLWDATQTNRLPKYAAYDNSTTSAAFGNLQGSAASAILVDVRITTGTVGGNLTVDVRQDAATPSAAAAAIQAGSSMFVVRTA